MTELIYKEECFQLVGFCMEVHRELGHGLSEVVYKDAVVFELANAGISFAREKKYEISYKGALLPHPFFADFIVWDKIVLEIKAVEKLAETHLQQVLHYLAAAKLKVGLLVNCGSNSLEWKRVVL